VVNFLKTQGYGVTSACGFKAAVEALNSQVPEFLVSDVRLGAFNALHLAIRHRRDHPGMQTIVLDCAHDPDIEREARRQGALYLVEPIDATELLKQISARLASDGAPRRWPRKVPKIPLYVNVVHLNARIVDVSEGGVQLEVTEDVEFPPVFDVICSELNATVQVKSVWTRPASRGWIRCGAEIGDPDPIHLESWRVVVGAVGEE
jgi:DNA-binding response OmpR family regulator